MKREKYLASLEKTHPHTWAAIKKFERAYKNHVPDWALFLTPKGLDSAEAAVMLREFIETSTRRAKMIEIKIDGLTFDCEWLEDDSRIALDAVYSNGQNLSEVISVEWWDKLEAALIASVKKRRAEDQLEAELDRNEAWGV